MDPRPFDNEQYAIHRNIARAKLEALLGGEHSPEKLGAIVTELAFFTALATGRASSAMSQESIDDLVRIGTENALEVLAA